MKYDYADWNSSGWYFFEININIDNRNCLE